MEGESTEFIEFMLAQIDSILDELLNQMTNSAIDDADGANQDTDNSEARLLVSIKQNPYITQADLAKELSLSRRTVQRMMKELMDAGVGSIRQGFFNLSK